MLLVPKLGCIWLTLNVKVNILILVYMMCAIEPAEALFAVNLNARCFTAHLLLTGESNTTILELFLRGTGGEKVREELQQYAVFDEDPCAVWAEALVLMVTTTAQLLYPFILKDGCCVVVWLLALPRSPTMKYVFTSAVKSRHKVLKFA